MSGFLLDQAARLACCRIRVRKTSLEMPIPPDLAKDFEYSSVSIDRQTPVPGVSPNGPSPLTPVVICENIELRNMASKSVAVDLALACACGDTFAKAWAKAGSGRPRNIGMTALPGMLPVVLLIRLCCITSPRCRPGSRRRP